MCILGSHTNGGSIKNMIGVVMHRLVGMGLELVMSPEYSIYTYIPLQVIFSMSMHEYINKTMSPVFGDHYHVVSSNLNSKVIYIDLTTLLVLNGSGPLTSTRQHGYFLESTCDIGS